MNCSTKVFMMRHLLMSNLFGSKAREIVLFLARISESEFVASRQIQEVVSSLPQVAQRRLKRQNTLSLRLVFSIKLFMDISDIE